MVEWSKSFRLWLYQVSRLEIFYISKFYFKNFKYFGDARMFSLAWELWEYF